MCLLCALWKVDRLHHFGIYYLLFNIPFMDVQLKYYLRECLTVYWLLTQSSFSICNLNAIDIYQLESIAVQHLPDEFNPFHCSWLTMNVAYFAIKTGPDMFYSAQTPNTVNWCRLRNLDKGIIIIKCLLFNQWIQTTIVRNEIC